MHSKPNTKTLIFAKEKEFIHEAAEWRDRRTRKNLISAFPEATDLEYLWDKEERWSEGWGKDDTVKSLVSCTGISEFLHEMHVQKMVLAWSEGDIFGPLRSNTHGGPVEWSVVLSSFNWAWLALCSRRSYHYCCVLVTQSCLTLRNPMDRSPPPGSSVHGDSPGRNTGVGSYALLQGIFPAQGLNPSLLHLPYAKVIVVLNCWTLPFDIRIPP